MSGGYILKNDWIEPFNNNFTVTKDMHATANPAYWVDGGENTFDNYGYFKIANTDKTIQTNIPFTTRNGADGVLYTETLTHDSVTWEIIHGWITSGIFVIKVKQSTGTQTSFKLLWNGNLGNGTSFYKLKTRFDTPTTRYITTYFHNNNLIDNPTSVQSSITVIPYDKTLIETDQDYVIYSTSGGNETGETISLVDGCTLIIQWGKVPMVNIQAWINNMLDYDYTRKYLMSDGVNGVKNWNGTSWVKVGDLPVTETMFLTYGHDKIPTTVRTGLLLTNPQLLMYTNRPTPPIKRLRQSIVPTAKIIKQVNNYDIPSGIKLVTIDVTITGSSILKFAVSIDNGVTWLYWAGAAWVIVNVDNASQFESNAMTATTVNAITQAQWAMLTTGTIIRFAIYLKQAAITDSCKLNNLRIDWI